MKIINFLVLLLFIGNTHILPLDIDDAIERKKIEKSDIYFIGTWYGGFFASFNGVLNHLSWCEKKGKIPVVYWDDRSLYYNLGGFNGKKNVWEYYFEPVAKISLKPKYPIELRFFPENEPLEFCVDYMDQATRDKAFRLISKYIKIKPRIQYKINAFYRRNMAGKRTIGIHVRGTDKYQEVPLVSAHEMIETALIYADGDTQFLIASDEERLMSEMKSLLQGRKVIYYPCYRSPGDKPLHLKTKRPPIAQSGEDVLVEVSLLSKCDLFIHTLSNVSTGALYFNPQLEHVVVV